MLRDPRFELLRARADALADGVPIHEMRIDPAYLKELLDEIEQLRTQQAVIRQAATQRTSDGVHARDY